MALIKSTVRYIWYTSWFTFALVVVVSALGLSVLRLVLPTLAENYRTDVEAVVSKLLQQPVEIGDMSASWRGFGPELVLSEVLFLQADGEGAVFRLDQARLGFDLLRLFGQDKLGLSRVSLSGFNLIIRRTKDGQISVAGLQSGQGDIGQSEGFELDQWLLGQERVLVENSSVYWIDHARSGRVWQFDDVHFSLKNLGERHLLDGSAVLPSGLGRDFSFALDIKGNPLQSSQWSGKGYVQGQDLNWSVFRTEMKLDQSPLREGRLSLKLWSEFEQGHFLRSTGEISLRDPSLVHAGSKPLKLELVSGKVRLSKTQTGWLFQGREILMLDESRRWEKTDLTLDLVHFNGGLRMQKFYTSYVDIGQSLRLANYFQALPRETKTNLESLKADGIARDVYVEIDESDPGLSWLQAEFSGVTLEGLEDFPAVYGISGSVKTNLHQGALQLNGSGVRVAYPGQLVKVMDFDQADGRLHWFYNDDYLQLSGAQLLLRNSTAHGVGEFQLFWPWHRHAPYLRLNVNVSKVQGNIALDYLPVIVPASALRKWWAYAINKGEVHDGHILFDGWADAYPFTNANGKFHIDGQAKNVDLTYLKGWPRVNAIHGQLLLENSRFEFEGERGKIGEAIVSKTHVQITDFSAADVALELEGLVSGSTTSKLAYLTTAPYLKEIFSVLKNVKVKGESQLHLSLLAPLRGKQALAVGGKVSLKNNEIVHAAGFENIATAVGGQLEFEDARVKGDVNGFLLGQAVSLNISSVSNKPDASTRLQLQGKYNIQSLVDKFEVNALQGRLSGEDQFNAEVLLPGIGSKHQPQLSAKLSLDNIASGLPHPLNKERGDSAALSVFLDMAKNHHDWRFAYDDKLSAFLEFDTGEAAYTFRKSSIIVGAGEASKPEVPGVSLSGQLQQISVDDWIDTFSPEDDGSHDRVYAVLPPWLAQVQVNIDSVRFLKRDFHHAAIKLSRSEYEHAVDLDSKEIRGRVTVPRTAGPPLVVDLDYLDLVPASEVAGQEQVKVEEPMDPRTLPPVKISSDILQFQGNNLGRLQVEVKPVDDGIFFGGFSIESKKMHISGDLDWRYRANRHTSAVNLRIKSENVGASMAALGYADTIKGGRGTISVTADWPDEPAAPLGPGLSGLIKMKFKEGQLLDLNPGAGKILAILSLQMLPKRLLLDFRDLFTEGFSFETVSGKFDLSGGVASTTDLIMSGPSANIHIVGRTDLVKKDYDQVVTVIPDVTASVPVLTWYLVNLPTAVIALALQNIFKSQIDDVVKFQYTITGPWDKPEVKKVAEGERKKSSSAATADDVKKPEPQAPIIDDE